MDHKAVKAVPLNSKLNRERTQMIKENHFLRTNPMLSIDTNNLFYFDGKIPEKYEYLLSGLKSDRQYLLHQIFSYFEEGISNPGLELFRFFRDSQWNIDEIENAFDHFNHFGYLDIEYFPIVRGKNKDFRNVLFLSIGSRFQGILKEDAAFESMKSVKH